MRFYRFKTFTTSYYFPKINSSTQFMYGLYSSYGGFLAKIYWYLFRKSKIVRSLTIVDEKDLDFPFQKIKEVDGTNSLMAFNLGSPGIEQKISILGYNQELHQPFFAKFSQKETAIQLTKNEISVYRILSDTGLVPQLFKESINQTYAYLKTEFIQGKRPENLDITSEILDLCILLKDYHLSDKCVNEEGLKMSLSHGDFCPWNMLINEGKFQLIDWELAADRPLGADLFTYIVQVSLLFSFETSLLEVIKANEEKIFSFFSDCGIDDYEPYLRAFAHERYEYELSKGNKERANKIKDLF